MPMPYLAAAAALFARSSDADLVKKAVEKYVDAFYLNKPELIREVVHPKLRKIGYWKQSSEYAAGSELTFEDLLKLADGTDPRHRFPKGATREVKVFDITDKLATARSKAVWGMDYFHLAKLDGKWTIVNIVWQGPEPSTQKSVGV